MNFAFGVSSRCEYSSNSPQVATTFLGVYFLTTPNEPTRIPDEEAPLLTPERVSYTLHSSSGSVTPTVPPGLSKRPSMPNIDISLTLNSPGALFLLATTPPVTTHATVIAHARQRSVDGPHASTRTRSASRSTVDRVIEALVRR